MLEEEYFRTLDEYENTQAEFNKSKADLNMQSILLEAQVNTINLSTSIAMLDSLQLHFTSELERKRIELELQKAEIERQKIIDKLKFLKSINDSEIRKMELRIKQQQNKIDQSLDQLSKLVLTSEVDGIVLHSTNWRTGEKVVEGDQVFGGMPTIEIPQAGEMQAKLQINETYFKQIELGQNIELRVDAIQDLIISGKIKHKAPVGKPVKRGSQVKVFEVIAELDSAFITVQPGLTVTCDVFVNMITDTLVVPVVCIFEDDSSKVVYVKSGNHFTKRTVEIASGNNKFAVIKTGLSGEEFLSNTKPPESLIIN